MIGRRLSMLLLAALVPLAALAGSTQTGTLRGTVFDDKGEPIVGATVVLGSPALIRERAVLTDAEGKWFAPSLPPGAYTVTARMEGYVVIQGTTEVQPDKTTPVALILKEGEATETVTVTASRPVIDKADTETATVLDTAYTNQLPVARSDLALLTFAPGVVDLDGDGNANFLGGTSNSNQYLVDGVSSRDPVTGTFGLNLNFDAIETVDVKLAGISAEYGQSQGGISNIITKSGGNDFTGSLRDTVSAPAWTSLPGTKSRDAFAPEVTEAQGLGFTYQRPALPLRASEADQKTNFLTSTLGGPVVPDRAWFFVAYDKVDNSAQAFLGDQLGGANGDGTYINFFDGENSLLKLTWQATNKHRLLYNWSEDPATVSHCYGFDFFGGPCFDTPNVDRQQQGGYLWTSKWNALWSPTLTSDASIGRYKSSFALTSLAPIVQRPGLPLSSTSEVGPAIDLSSGATFDANIFDEFPADRDREQYEAQIVKFLDTKELGSHTIKIGADYQTQTTPGNTAVQGNAIFYFLFDNPPSAFGGTGDPYDIANRAYYLWVDFALPNNSTPKNAYTAAYVNDDWQLDDHWAFNLGLRWEQSKNSSDIGEAVLDSSGLAPRLGASFDVRGDGKHVVKATAARYLQGINLTTLTPFTRQAGGLSSYDIFFNQNFPNTGTPDFVLISQVRPDPTAAQFQQGLKPQTIDEYGLSYEFLATPTLGLSLRVLDRSWNDILTTVNRYEYPDGIPRKITTLVNNPDARRSYKAAILGVDKRYAHDFQLSASYTWSRAQGNVTTEEGFDSFGSFAGVPQSTENRYGLLPWDATHAAKLQGFYQVPIKNARQSLSLGTVFQALSGPPFARNRAQQLVVGPGPDGVQDIPLGSPVDPTAESNDQADSVLTFFEPRGSARIGTAWNLDLSLIWRYKLAKDVSWETRFEVFNVTDEQKPLAVSTAWFENPSTATQLATNHVFGYPTAYGGSFQPNRAYRVQFALTW